MHHRKKGLPNDYQSITEHLYDERDITVKVILTENGREFYGTEMLPFELYVTLNKIELRRTKVRRPQTGGFVERFLGTVKSEFF